MNWYKGDIAQAVADARAKNAIFVVFIKGNDANSEKLLKMIDENKIRSKLESENFVGICIESGSQSYMQFASIYQMVPVPSIFFIGRSGTPIEIGTAIINTVDELDDKIERALEAHRGNVLKDETTPSGASCSLIEAEKNAAKVESNQLSKKTSEPEISSTKETPQAEKKPEATEEIVCDGDVCYKKPKETEDANLPVAENVSKTENTENEKVVQNQTEGSDFDARLAETRKLIAEKRQKALEEEKQQEKERELRRRREGKEMQNLQEWQREQEFKKVKENIRRERLEEQAARERIRAQIAADRAERAQRFDNGNTAATTSTAATAKEDVAKLPINSNAIADTVRLQFRFPNGEAQAHTFNSSDTISDVRSYVGNELLADSGIKEFTLATAYPRHEFVNEDNTKTLLDLGLFPSAVILVITKPSSTPAAIIKSHGGIVNIFSTVLWTVLSPFVSVFSYIRGAIFGGKNNGTAEQQSGAQKRASEDGPLQNEAAKRRNLDRFLTGPSTSGEAGLNSQRNETDNNVADSIPYRRYGASNVHRLSDKRKDSDDENATWNGNSTQQQ